MIGTTLGPYRIDRELGAGGMGTVYLATADGDAPGVPRGAPVAIKVVHPHLLSAPGFLARFRREADIGRAVRHENVVRTLGVHAAEIDGRSAHYLVMEYVEGRTLRALLREMKTIPEGLLREIAAQVASGLAAIHELSIVHRDLKPENVLVTRDHQVRIMDLGVARLQEATVAITKEGQFTGSLLYAAPEQFRRERVGPATDLYSLGVVLYELATGVNPFERDDAAQVISAHLNEVPRAPRDVATEISAFLSELTTALLAKQAADRVASAAELRDVLRAGESSAWWTARERTVRERERRLPPVQVRRETELVGREAPLALLGAAWERARHGQGNVVFVEGEAGIGKTRLVDAFLRTLPPDVNVLYGAYSPTGGLGGLSDAITGRFGRSNLADALRPYLTVTPSLVAPFAALLLHEPPPGGEPMRGEAIQAVFCHLLRALGSERPTVWVADDLHLAPEEGRAIALAMARAVEDCRALFVVAARPGIPEEESGDLLRLEHVRRATLGRLSPRQVIELLRIAFRSEALAERLGGKIAYKSDGVPYFVLEMIRGLKEGRFVRRLPDGSFVETQAVSDIEVPSAVRDLIEGRLRSLSDDDRELLDVGAVMGHEFDPDLVARVRGRRRVQVLEALAKIERRSGVVRAAGRAYRFDHHQIREVLETQLSPALREEYHAMLAEAFAEREQLAGKDPRDVPGEAALFLASHGLASSRPDAAVPHVRRALEHLSGTNRWADRLELADRALGIRGLLAGADQARTLLARAAAIAWLGHGDETGSAAREAVAAADACGDVLLRCQSRNVLFTSLRDARLEDARAVAEEQLALARSGDSDEALVGALGNLGDLARRQGRFEDARRLHDEQLAVATRAGDRRSEALAWWYLAELAREERDADAARAAAQRAIELGAARGSRIEAFASVTCAILEIGEGRLGKALALFRRALELNRAAGSRINEGISLGNLAEIHVRLGDREGAEPLAREAEALARATGGRAQHSQALGVAGRLADEADRPAEAKQAYSAAAGAARALGMAQLLTEALVGLARVAIRSGDVAEARRALTESVEVARRAGDPAAVVLPSCYLALASGTDAAGARVRLAELGSRVLAHDAMEARFVLWKAARDPGDLAEAHRLLMHLREHAPNEYRESILTNVALHREIVAAATPAGS